MKNRHGLYGIGAVIAVTIGALTFANRAALATNAVGLSAFAHDCDNDKLPPDVRVTACTALMHSNLIRGRRLAAFYILRGDAYSAKPDYALALDDYNKAISMMPDFPDALDRRGAVYEKLNKPEDASASFEAAGVAWLTQRDCQKAGAAFENALKDNPKSAAGLYGLGLCASRAGDNAAGEKDRNAALALDPSVAKRFQE